MRRTRRSRKLSDDLLVMCKTRREAESAVETLTAILADLGLEPKQAKTRIVHLKEGDEGVDFLGFHHRWVRAHDRRRRHLTFLARWPAPQAMQHARDRLRELTARDRLPLPVEQVVQDVNRFLQGWAGYFRYGNSARAFDTITAYAIRRLSIYIASRHGRARGYSSRAAALSVATRQEPRRGSIACSAAVSPPPRRYGWPVLGTALPGRLRLPRCWRSRGGRWRASESRCRFHRRAGRVDPRAGVLGLMAVVRFEGEDGSFMLVETTETVMLVERTQTGEGSRLDLVSREDGVGATAVTRLEDSLASVRGAAVALMGAVGELDKHDSRFALDEVTLDLALSLGVEGGVVVAKGSARAEASVTLTWRAAPPAKA